MEEWATMTVASFIVAMIIFPYFIRKFRESGRVVKDYYKPGQKMVPLWGGLIEVFVYLLLTSFFWIFYGIEFEYAAVFVLVLFAFFGILDDLVAFPHIPKMVIPAIFSFPLIALIPDSSISFFSFGSIDLGLLYFYIIVPVYIMVAANLVNMHSGFNGLSSGNALIVLFSLMLYSVFKQDFMNIYYVLPFIGVALAFLYYNFYPSKIFEGDAGSLMLGAAIGSVIVIQKLEVVGFIMLIPHVFNFLLYVYWRIKRIPHEKFGRVRKDGTLEVPNPLTVKWIMPYYFRVTERQASLYTYLVTTLFCMVGLLI